MSNEKNKFYEKTFTVKSIKNSDNRNDLDNSEICALKLEDSLTGATAIIKEFKLGFFKINPGQKLTIKIFDEQKKLNN
jgi:hypothetical protein